MIKKIFAGLLLPLVLSCNKNDNNDSILQENGNIWLSGGLAFCAEQILLDNGDTLIVDWGKIASFTSGDRVNVRYKEIDVNSFCPPGIDCEIIEIRKIE